MLNSNISIFSNRLPIKRGMVFGILIITALFAFEIFNYSTTDFALTDLLGELDFLSIKWATILSIAFCGIDFAGIARLFTPEQGEDEPKEVWYLFGAWMLAAVMNAMLTWWGVSIAIINHETLGNAVVPRETLIKVVPIFVAIMVWLIRVLIIGTITMAGDRLFNQAANRQASASHSRGGSKNQTRNRNARDRNNNQRTRTRSNPVTASSYRPNRPITQVKSSNQRVNRRDTSVPITRSNGQKSFDGNGSNESWKT
jgi:hypothetical protein